MAADIDSELVEGEVDAVGVRRAGGSGLRVFDSALHEVVEALALECAADERRVRGGVFGGKSVDFVDVGGVYHYFGVFTELFEN